MADVLTLADMPDLSDWRLPVLWTLEQTALLWAGINPRFSLLGIYGRNTHQTGTGKNCITGFSGGIVLKTLTVKICIARRKRRDLLSQPKNCCFQHE